MNNRRCKYQHKKRYSADDIFFFYGVHPIRNPAANIHNHDYRRNNYPEHQTFKPTLLTLNSVSTFIS